MKDPSTPRMRALLQELFPMLRSITGAGLRATLSTLKRELPELRLHEVPSGEAAFDWTIPPEWSVRKALVTDPDGRVVADVERHNLMLVNYSRPFTGRLTLEELRPYLHSLPAKPHAIPYRTTYYRREWGFCLPHVELAALVPGEYAVTVDTSLEPGSLTYGELLIPGRTSDEMLLSAHVCHPSLANDNLSAVVVLTELARWLSREPRRLTYRLLFAPGTIGTLAFLARTPEALSKIQHGLVLAGLGDQGPLTYKRTLRGDSPIDRTVALVLANVPGRSLLPFEPNGYDERQYASPGIRLDVGRLGRTPPGSYPEYHTSLDNLGFVKDESLSEALMALKDIATIVDEDRRFQSLAPFGEPQLGSRGLYEATDTAAERSALMWLLTLADGRHSLVDVAERAKLDIREVTKARDRLVGAGLLDPKGGA